MDRFVADFYTEVPVQRPAISNGTQDHNRIATLPENANVLGNVHSHAQITFYHVTISGHLS